MRTPGKTTHGTQVLTIAAALAFAPVAVGQDSTSATASSQPAQSASNSAPKPELTAEQQALAQDFYRAEFVILERKIEPDQVNEKMAGRLPEPPDLSTAQVLRHTDQTGATRTTLQLVSPQELHLAGAVRRLKNSGKYRVLLAEGWYQAFPPDYEGKPLWVTVGDWLPGAEHTDVQGQITIDRQRYLHVNVELNHWLPQSSTANTLGIDLNAETPSRPRPPRIPIRPEQPESNQSSDAQTMPMNADASDNAQVAGESPQRPPLIAGLNWPRAELLTWIKETRRMRSEEVHFLDSPTLGVLIFFKKIEPEDAAPLILKLGLTGKPAPREAS